MHTNSLRGRVVAKWYLSKHDTCVYHSHSCWHSAVALLSFTISQAVALPVVRKAHQHMRNGSARVKQARAHLSIVDRGSLVEARAALSKVYGVKESNLQTHITTSVQQCKAHLDSLDEQTRNARARLKPDRRRTRDCYGLAPPATCSQQIHPCTALQT